MSDRHRWLLVDLGHWRKPRVCAHCDSWQHPYACFAEDGMLDCVCGLDRARRPVAPEVAA